MKTLILLSLCMIGCWSAAPVAGDTKPVIPIVKFDETLEKSGAYKVDTLSADNVHVSETGLMKDLGDKGGPVSVKSGEFSYRAPNSQEIQEKWTADEKGFVAHGSHLPTSPPIPKEIVKSLEENKAKAPY